MTGKFPDATWVSKPTVVKPLFPLNHRGNVGLFRSGHRTNADVTVGRLRVPIRRNHQRSVPGGSSLVGKRPYRKLPPAYLPHQRRMGKNMAIEECSVLGSLGEKHRAQ